jgi:uncharacterized protein
MYEKRRQIGSLATILFLTLSPGCAPAGTTEGIAWSTWSNQLFNRAAVEHKFVLLNLENRWCQDCREMEADTYADESVQALIRKKYIPVKVDSNARPDLSNRYWNYALPGIVVFNSDGSEIVRQQSYMPPRQMASMLQAIIDDPSPGPSVKLEPAVQYSASPSIDPAVLKDVQKSFDSQYDIAAQGWAFAVQYLDSEFVEYGLANSRNGGRVNDRYLRLAIRQSRQLVDPAWGGVYQSLIIPVSDDDQDHTSRFLRIQISGPLDTTGDSWNTPHFEKTAAVEAQAIEIFSAGYDRWHEQSDLMAALNVAGYVHSHLRSRDGAFYTGQAGYLDGLPSDEDFFARDDQARKAIGIPTIDKNVYARENGRLIAALCKLYLITNERSFVEEGERSARWVMEHRALPGGGFSHGAHDSGGPYLADALEMGRAFLALYRATQDALWLERAQDTLGFIEKTFVRSPLPGVISSASETDLRYKPHANREENAALVCFIVDLARVSRVRGHEELLTFAMRYLVTKEVATANFAAPVLLATKFYAEYVNGAALPAK